MFRWFRWREFVFAQQRAIEPHPIKQVGFLIIVRYQRDALPRIHAYDSFEACSVMISQDLICAGGFKGLLCRT